MDPAFMFGWCFQKSSHDILLLVFRDFLRSSAELEPRTNVANLTAGTGRQGSVAIVFFPPEPPAVVEAVEKPRRFGSDRVAERPLVQRSFCATL